MIRRALLLGFYSIGGQVLLLRELVASLNGDELFISTALFGWLMAVAIGAYIGGRRRTGAHGLFLPAAILLPVTLLLTRFSPMLTGHLVGEVIPFTTAAVISIVVMFPVGVISGWMFPAISRQHIQTDTSIVRVYLFEGIGAFIGGLVIVLIVGMWFSSLMMAMVISNLVLVVEWASYGRSIAVKLARAGAILLVPVIILPATWWAENRLEDIQHRPFDIVNPYLPGTGAFETHYGREAILMREGELVLLTDNSIEAVYPDLPALEDLLIAPMVYNPSAKRVLYIGRPEQGLGELAENLPGVTVAGLDPRIGPLTMQYLILRDSAVLERINSSDTNWVVQYHSVLFPPDDDLVLNEVIYGDPVDYFSVTDDKSEQFDIVTINAGNLGSFKSNRLITPFFLQTVKRRCAGVLLVYTPYDTDNLISPDEKAILSTIYNVLSGSFGYVDVWPGTTTLFIASEFPETPMLPLDTIIARIEAIEYEPQFVSVDYLSDRLSDIKRRRLFEAVTNTSNGNSFDKPQLLHKHLLYQSNVNSLDRAVLTFITEESRSMIIIAAVIVLAALVGSLTGGRHRFGLFLFFVAGVVSLSLELIVFYTFQSLVGALYSQMAILIGAFMLGLAVGTFVSSLYNTKLWGYFALVALFALTIGFEMTYDSLARVRQQSEPILLYHMSFLFVMAAATGALFVAATRHYYVHKPKANRGIGYAFEIGGSSFGALFTTAVLLPVVGLSWLLTGIAAVIALAFVGLVLKR